MADAIGEATIINTAQLDRLVAHLRSCGRFAFDTEFVSEDTFEPVLCLIQVATRKRLAVIDPWPVRDLSPFWDVATDPSIEVVMHAAGEDLRICLMQAGKLPAARLRRPDRRRPGRSQLSAVAGQPGWSGPRDHAGRQRNAHRLAAPAALRRPAPVCPRRRPPPARPGRSVSAAGSTGSSKAWAEAEFADFVESIARRADEDRWRRLPGLNQLSRRGLEMARRLSDWREDEARRQNRPLRQVMRDDLLVGDRQAAAPESPRSRGPARLQPPALLQPSDEILAILDQARSVPEEQLPEPFSRRRSARPRPWSVPALGRACPVLCAKPDRRLARRQRRRSQAPDPLAPRRPG